MPIQIRNVPPSLLVFSLVDGQLIRRLELYGTLTEDYLWYADGPKVVVAVVEAYLTTALLCDILWNGRVPGRVTLPSRLRARDSRREAKRLPMNTNGGVLLPVHIKPNGDIIATSSEAWKDNVEVLRWREADFQSCTVDLKLTLLRRFLEHGSPREGEGRLLVSRPLTEGSGVKEVLVAVARQTVIIFVYDGSDSPRNLYLSLE